MPLAKYNYAQLKALWIKNGGKAGAAGYAAAIALAESGGDPNATHVNADGSVDHGLWQINSVHGALSTLDPNANARAAVEISGNGSNFKPWTTFTNGSYAKFLRGHLEDVSKNPEDPDVPNSSSATGGVVGAVIDAPMKTAQALSDLASVFEKLVEGLFNSSTWFRVGKVVVGVFLGLFAVVILARPLTDKVVSTAKTAAEVAAVA